MVKPQNILKNAETTFSYSVNKIFLQILAINTAIQFF